jgi:hypothetical protein
MKNIVKLLLLFFSFPLALAMLLWAAALTTTKITTKWINK